jgi:hypothetical protein
MIEFDLSASQVFLNGCPPFDSALVEMHFWHTTSFETVNGHRKFLAKSFFLDLSNRIHVRLERKHQRF